MAVFPSHNIVYEHDKKAKEKVRKCGGSAKRKAVKLGQEARVFSATIHYNPTYGQLDGAIHVPAGQSIPDVNQFLLDLYHGRQHLDRRRRSRLTRSTSRHLRRESTPILDEITVETSDSESQDLPTGAVNGGGAGEHADADPQLASGGDQHDSDHFEGEAAARGLRGSVEDAVYSLTESIDDVDNADADAAGSPEAIVVTPASSKATGKDEMDESAGRQTDRGTSVRDDLIAPGTCDVEIGCLTSTDNDFDWSGLELPESKENGPVMSDWLVVDVEEALHNGGASEAAERTTVGNMQTKNMGQRRLFERVSKQLWRAKQDRTAAEIAAEGGSSDGDGVPGRSEYVLEDGCKPKSQPNTGMQCSTGLMASRTAVKSPTTVRSGVGAPMQQQVRFFQALALRFRRQAQAGAATD